MRVGCVLSLIISAWLAAPALARTICGPAMLSSNDIKEETADYTIEAEYPVLCQPKASQTVRDEVTRQLATFKANFTGRDLRDTLHKHAMLTEYEVWQAGQGRYVSVKLQVTIFMGWAHPNHWPVTWVFDMIDGHALTLSDVFCDVDAALAKIAPTVRTLLRESLGEMGFPYMLNPGTAPERDNYRYFIFTEKGITFIFPHYSVAPYVAGQQVVTIPWERLQSTLTKDLEEALLR